MPIWEYECDGCYSITETHTSLRRRPESVSCYQCGGVAKRTFRTPPSAINTAIPRAFDGLSTALGTGRLETSGDVDKALSEGGFARCDYLPRQQQKARDDLREQASRFL